MGDFDNNQNNIEQGFGDYVDIYQESKSASYSAPQNVQSNEIHSTESQYVQYNAQNNTQTKTQYNYDIVSENVFAGIIGAILFALIGGAIHFILYQFGYIAMVCGVIIFVLAYYGYCIFAKVGSVKGVIVALVVSVVIIFATEYLSLAFAVFNTLKKTYDITLFQAIKAVPEVLKSSKVLFNFIFHLAGLYAICGVSAFETLKKR